MSKKRATERDERVSFNDADPEEALRAFFKVDRKAKPKKEERKQDDSEQESDEDK